MRCWKCKSDVGIVLWCDEHQQYEHVACHGKLKNMTIVNPHMRGETKVSGYMRSKLKKVI